MKNVKSARRTRPIQGIKVEHQLSDSLSDFYGNQLQIASHALASCESKIREGVL